MKNHYDLLLQEVRYKAVKSSSASGQNVNKVASKVVLTFDLHNSKVLSEEEKIRLKINLHNRLTLDFVLVLNCDEDRSQLKNKIIVTKRFLDSIKQGLHIPKERKPTKIPKTVIRKRIKNKKRISDLKKNRKRPKF
jgi:ribosome-associated protein